MVLTINSLSSSSTLINKNIKFPILKIKYFLVNFAPICGSLRELKSVHFSCTEKLMFLLNNLSNWNQ